MREQRQNVLILRGVKTQQIVKMEINQRISENTMVCRRIAGEKCQGTKIQTKTKKTKDIWRSNDAST